jgi:heparanase
MTLQGAGTCRVLLLTLLLHQHLQCTVSFPNGTGNTVMFAPYTLVPTSIVPESFLSFNFDWNLNQTKIDAWTNASFGWSLDLQNQRLRRLAQALAPANLRIGGSAADSAVYNEEFVGGIPCPDEVVVNKFCLTPARWDEVIEFADTTGLRIAFTLNMMAGRCGKPSCGHTGTGPWNSHNAFALLNYTATKYPNFSNHGFELGNELEFNLSPEQTSTALKQLRSMVNQLWPEVHFRPRVIGPDLNPRPDWLALMLDGLEPGDLDAITYHMYPGFGRSVDLPDLIPQPGWLDFTHQIMSATQRAVLSQPAGRSAELWIGETAAAWASGTAGVCNGFVSGFWWLDQLGAAASTGHGAMCRQCLVGGNYTLIDQLEGFKPNPDYWTAWLWRQTMGTKMIAVTQVMPYEGDFKPETRSYMSCTKIGSPGYKKGAVTMIYLNTGAQNASILLYQQSRMQESRRLAVVSSTAAPWGPTPPPFSQLPRLEFVLTPGDESAGLLSRDIALNGIILVFGKDMTFPELVGKRGEQENWVVPGKSYGFAVYPEAAAPACM